MNVKPYKSSQLHLTAVSVDRGIITFIRPDGVIDYYTQRNVHKLSSIELQKAIACGLLHHTVLTIPELPSNITLSYEEPSIQGRVQQNLPISAFRKKLKLIQ